MKIKNHKIKFLIVALAATGLVGWALYTKVSQTKTAATDPNVKTLQDNVTKTAEDANKNFTGTTDNGGVTDTSGSTTKPAASQPTTPASSAMITLTTPSDGAKIADGSAVSGSAKVTQVQYRIKDDDYGVLATGPISVVDGKYSGTISIRPKGTTGTLEIFNFTASGAEENNVKINIKF